MSAEPVLEVTDLVVEYGGTTALRGVTLSVAPGRGARAARPVGLGQVDAAARGGGIPRAAVGHRCAWPAGPSSADGRPVPPERRDLAVVFQNYALWPHLSAVDTVAYPVRRRGAGRAQARAEALDLLRLLRIDHLAARRPAELSGGEQQRVGLARALARRPSLYLFDEPTAHLDTHVRAVFLDELVARQRDSGAAAVYATHDAEEALGLADRVALLRDGRLLQVGTPRAGLRGAGRPVRRPADRPGLGDPRTGRGRPAAGPAGMGAPGRPAGGPGARGPVPRPALRLPRGRPAAARCSSANPGRRGTRSAPAPAGRWCAAGRSPADRQPSSAGTARAGRAVVDDRQVPLGVPAQPADLRLGEPVADPLPVQGHPVARCARRRPSRPRRRTAPRSRSPAARGPARRRPRSAASCRRRPGRPAPRAPGPSGSGTGRARRGREAALRPSVSRPV